MLKTFLLVLGACTMEDGVLHEGYAAITCLHTTEQATVFEYDRYVDCVRAKAQIRLQEFESYCTGKPFNPADLTNG